LVFPWSYESGKDIKAEVFVGEKYGGRGNLGGENRGRWLEGRVGIGGESRQSDLIQEERKKLGGGKINRRNLPRGITSLHRILQGGKPEERTGCRRNKMKSL